MGIATLLAPWGGSLADQCEFRKPHKGRTQILMAGVLIGSFVFMFHGVQHLGSSAETTTTFWKSTIWHFALRMVFAASFSMTIPVLDGVTLAHLEADNNRKNNDDNDDDANKAPTSYGQERLHGAVWWAVTSLALGPCLDRWGFQVLYGFALVSTIACVVCINYCTSGQQQLQLQLQQPENHGRTINNACNSKSSYQRNDDKEASATEKDQTQEHFDKTPLANISKPNDATEVPMTTLFRFMWGALHGCTFLTFLSCLRAGTSVVDQMAFLCFECLHSTCWMCSITVTLTALFEIPIFHLAPALLQKWGPGTLQFVAGIACVTRVVGHTLVPKGEMAIILLLEPLHGVVTHACSKASSVEFASRLMPTGYESSGQGSLGLFEGLGCMTGLFVGGWMEEHLGPRTMCRLLALVVFLGMSIFVIGSVMRKQEQQTPLSSSLSSSSPLNAESRKQEIAPAKLFDNNNEANQSVMNNCSEETAPLMVEKQGNLCI